MNRIKTAPFVASLVLGLAMLTTGCWTSSSAEETGSSQASASGSSGSKMQARSEASGDESPTPKKRQTDPIDPGEVPAVGTKVTLSEAQWRKRLDAETFKIMRKAGTEPAGSGELLHNKKTGIYYCAACGAPLYSSRHKFDSGTGWPSYYRGFAEGRLDTKDDDRFGMTRTEVHCARCGGHLGHIFNDGPPPTGKRHCINSAALTFRPANKDGVVEDPPEPIPSDEARSASQTD
jgi:peptide-methionine (R)-S-oxide reductase